MTGPGCSVGCRLAQPALLRHTCNTIPATSLLSRMKVTDRHYQSLPHHPDCLSPQLIGAGWKVHGWTPCSDADDDDMEMEHASELLVTSG